MCIYYQWIVLVVLSCSYKKAQNFSFVLGPKILRIGPGPPTLDRFIRDGELYKIVANYLRFDLNLVEGLAIVDTNNASNHLRDNDHVAEMGLHWLWLLTRRSILFLFTAVRDN